MITEIFKDDSNIASMRKKYGKGLHWIIGDTHCEARTLYELMQKINFDPMNDRVYFLGDYNGDSDPTELLKYISGHYSPDYGSGGFHLIRGNHERESEPMYPLENMPDIIVIRGNVMNYYLVHAGMASSAFELINEDMAENPDKWYYAYRLSEKSTEYNAPLRQITWSRFGLYSHNPRLTVWPDEESLRRNKACIIHGHTPYCFFGKKCHSFYGRKSLFWKKQHIWFSEDLQAFDIDSNIKGRNNKGESYRGLTCICLESLEDIAKQENGYLKAENIANAENFVFTADLVCGEPASSGNLDKLLSAAPEMKTIDIDSDGNPYFIS